MRKLCSLLLVFALILGCSALAEDNLVEHDFGHFTLAIPADAMGTITDEITANVPFITIYENYDENALFNSSLDCVWNEVRIDFSAVEPDAYAQSILDSLVTQFTSMGLGISDAAVMDPIYADKGGADMFSCLIYMVVDYTALGIDLKTPTYTLLSMRSDDAVGGSYSFTVTSDDLDNCTMLRSITDSIRWTL